MADMNQFFKKYDNYKSTFKETSFDSNNSEYLCSDEMQEIINFDSIIENKYPNSNLRPQSFDALYVYEASNQIFMIEFKNENKPNKNDIENKMIAGKCELDSMLQDLNIASKNYQFIFCLVYNQFKPKHERHKRGLYKSIRFEFLNKYKKNGVIHDIFTENVDFFTKQFNKISNKELTC